MTGRTLIIIKEIGVNVSVVAAFTMKINANIRPFPLNPTMRRFRFLILRINSIMEFAVFVVAQNYLQED